MSYIMLLRPSQWLKNLMLFFPPFLGGGIAICFQLGSLIPFASFCLASSATYILNDIADRSNDIHHPVKKYRPIPAGNVSVINASCLAAVLLLSAAILAFIISLKFLLILTAYLAVSSLYTLSLKNFPVIDLFCISSGFILRLFAGGEAFDTVVSEWLFITVFLLAVFLSTGKRFSEKRSLGNDAGQHRRSLAAYPDGFLNGLLFMTGSAVLVTYTMYAVNRHSQMLLYSVPLCCFGLMRYMLRVYSGKGGDPTESLIQDFPLSIVGVVWVVMVTCGIYLKW